MFENRIRDYFAASGTVGVAAATAAFVPCPCSLLAVAGPSHASFVAEVYRMAQELTAAQMRKPVRTRMPAFSAN